MKVTGEKRKGEGSFPDSGATSKKEGDAHFSTKVHLKEKKELTLRGLPGELPTQGTGTDKNATFWKRKNHRLRDVSGSHLTASDSDVHTSKGRVS